VPSYLLRPPLSPIDPIAIVHTFEAYLSQFMNNISDCRAFRYFEKLKRGSINAQKVNIVVSIMHVLEQLSFLR